MGHSIENPCCSPLQMSLKDKVGLVENVLDHQWELELEIGDEENNFNRIMDYMWPSYKQDAEDETQDKSFARVIRIIRESHLKVKDFFDDGNASLVTQSKRKQKKNTDDANETPESPELRIWKNLVKHRVDRAVSEEFGE